MKGVRHPRLNLSFTSLNDFKIWVKKWSEQLRPGSVIALYGEVGAGKTQFVKFLAEALGSGDVSQSPSFAIHHSYTGGRVAIEHVDLYRIENLEDLESTGFWDLFENRNSVVAVEWAERIPASMFPLNWELWEIHLA